MLGRCTTRKIEVFCAHVLLSVIAAVNIMFQITFLGYVKNPKGLLGVVNNNRSISCSHSHRCLRKKLRTCNTSLNIPDKYVCWLLRCIKIVVFDTVWDSVTLSIIGNKNFALGGPTIKKSNQYCHHCLLQKVKLQT